MSLFGGIGTIAGGIFGGPGGAAAGGAIGGGLDAIFGGGSSDSSSSTGGYDFAAQVAAMNNPLTAAYQGLSLLQGAYAAALGQQGTTQASAQLSILTEGLQRAQKDAQLRASAAGYTFGKGIDSQYNLSQANLSTALQAPQLLSQAGSAMLAGENDLANYLGKTNVDIKKYQEQLRGQVAADQGFTLSDVYEQRAENQGLLALGAQSFENAAQLDRVRTLGDLTRIQAQTKANLAEKKWGSNQAIAGTRMFA